SVGRARRSNRENRDEAAPARTPRPPRTDLAPRPTIAFAWRYDKLKTRRKEVIRHPFGRTRWSGKSSANAPIPKPRSRRALILSCPTGGTRAAGYVESIRHM